LNKIAIHSSQGRQKFLSAFFCLRFFGSNGNRHYLKLISFMFMNLVSINTYLAKKCSLRKVSFILLWWCLSGISYTSAAQQWIVKKYEYDSLLNMAYGEAENFLGQTDSLRFDLYLPRCNDPSQISRRPLILFIHGGAFLAGSKEDVSITDFCKQFARRGYVTASMNYRLGFVTDDQSWSCNYPNYSCIFAADTAEWYRAWYRGVQDAKGCLRYLMNRSALYRIDTANVFLGGESAGAFLALGAGLLDDPVERPVQTFALNPLLPPNGAAANCPFYSSGSFPLSAVARPDLGDIDGNIEPTQVSFKIKGIVNIYGAMFQDLLQVSGTPFRPSIYSFHQPCDIVVPIDSGRIYEGLSWCMTNGYGCFGIANTPMVYGSRAFSNLNIQNNYGYSIENHFSQTNFPYNFFFGAGSCADQVNNPCHAIDNRNLRETEIANFLAPLVSTFPVCDTLLLSENTLHGEAAYTAFPNPVNDILMISCSSQNNAKIKVFDIYGRELILPVKIYDNQIQIDMGRQASGVYILQTCIPGKRILTERVVKR
jgi:hypothetical protein